MLQTFSNMFGKMAAPKSGPVIPEPFLSGSPLRRVSGSGGMTFSKVFRWRLPDGQRTEPKTVEIVGTFTHWQKVALQRDGMLDAWHITLHHLQGNRTHHYMLLLDGKPAHDKTCDGLAVPTGPQEEQFAYPTEKGPRVFMLFAQTK
jgi:hypothetical protein